GYVRILVWDVTASEPVALALDSGRNIGGVVFSADGRYLAEAGGAECSVPIWQFEGNQARRVATIRGFDDRVEPVAFSPDGRLLAVSCGEGRRLGAVRLYDVTRPGWPRVKDAKVDDYNVRTMRFGFDSKKLAEVHHKWLSKVTQPGHEQA